MDVYVYYAIAATDAASVRVAVAHLQRTLAQRYNVVSKLKRRVEEAIGLQTWMEIYPQVPHGFEQVIEQLASEAGLTALIEGKRHIEIFEEIEPCV